MFDHLYNVTSGKKLLAMTENGPIPDVANMFSSDATWSWFMTWDNLATSQNTIQHLIDVYNDPRVITLENYITTLPVSLIVFTAKADGKKVKIEWTTAFEINSQSFEIKHSVNGIDFYHLATVMAKENSSVKNDYTVFDNNPTTGINYYQLIQYDMDGKSINYGVRKVNANNFSMCSVKLYPNPINDHIGIHLTNFNGKKIKVNLIDMNGRIIWQTEIKTPAGQSYYKLPLNFKPVAGQYILRVEGEGLRESLKVIY
jgi:hypothetical protein